MFEPVYMKDGLEGKKLDKAIGKLAKLTEDKLAKAAVKAPSAAVRKAAVEKLKDQAVIAEAAKNDTVSDVRKTALNKLTDQSALADIAKNESDKDIRKTAVKKLTDKAALSEISKKEPDKDIRLSAINNMTDQAALCELAENDPDKDIVLSSIKKINDKYYLGKLTYNDNADIRHTVMEKLTDEYKLIDIAENNPYEEMRKAAVDKLTESDPLHLYQITTEGKYEDARSAALENITDEHILSMVVTDSQYEDMRKSALDKMPDNDAVITQITLHCPYADTRAAALEKIKSQHGFELAACLSEYEDTCKAALDKLSDEDHFVIIAITSSFAEIRKAALEKVNDKELLKEIYEDCTYDDTRELVLKKLSDQGVPEDEIKQLPKNASAKAGLPASAELCSWASKADAKKWLTAIQKTWNVEVTPYTISEQDAKALEQKFPMASDTRTEQAQYAVEIGSNSIFWHEYGAWTDFGYAKFLYKGNIYYVNVSPTVKLTQSMYDRTGDLNNMAKILVTLLGQTMERNTLLLVLDGDLKDQT